MGEDGAKVVVVNSVGREIDPRWMRCRFAQTKAARVQITTISLTRAAEEGFKAGGFNGAAVVMDPRTGEVLAFTSRPGYDPNDFAAGVEQATWNGLLTDPLKPLNNRATQGLYSPGSTFKIVVAVAALEEGVVRSNFRVSCGGGATFYGRYFQCHKKGGHGSVDMREAMEKSCNVYFYTLGNMLGVDKIHKWATLLGLGEKTGIDLPNEVSGLVPSTEWKRRRYNEKWYAGETISVSIGQGQVSLTPVSQAVMMSTVANGGTRFVPQLLKGVNDGKDGSRSSRLPPSPAFNSSPKRSGAARRLVLLVNAPATAGAGVSKGGTCRKDRHRAGISLTGGKKAAGAPNAISAIMAGSSSSRRATNPKLRASSSASTTSTATFQRRSRST